MDDGDVLGAERLLLSLVDEDGLEQHLRNEGGEERRQDDDGDEHGVLGAGDEPVCQPVQRRDGTEGESGRRVTACSRGADGVQALVPSNCGVM